VRPAEVAGQFYPADPMVLAASVNALRAAGSAHGGRPTAVIAGCGDEEICYSSITASKCAMDSARQHLTDLLAQLVGGCPEVRGISAAAH
jgi:predicted class III extradiol MEMO1 family dioxygenase